MMTSVQHIVRDCFNINSLLIFLFNFVQNGPVRSSTTTSQEKAYV